MMTVETLRRAAEAMRSDAMPSAEFFDAVADWLSSVSNDVDKRDNPHRVGGRYPSLRIPDERAALTVARAYLGSHA